MTAFRATPPAHCGLVTANPNHRIALRGIAIRSHLTAMGHKTTVEQTYVNHEPQPIEAVYTFPLADRAAVCGLEIITGDRVLAAEIDTLDKAVERHEDAMTQGHGSFLLEQHRPDVFSVNVGNLKPGQVVTIRITYVCEVDLADKTLRVNFPTTIAPRYATATASDPLQAQIDCDVLNPPHVLSVPYGLTLEVDVDLGRPIAAVRSPSHAIEVRDGVGGRKTVRLTGTSAQMDRDVVLEIELAANPQPTAVVERTPTGETFAAVTFVPTFEGEVSQPTPSHVLFVIDCSGSMQGPSIAQARTALALCLRSLSPGDVFNICRFGNTYEWMSSQPLVYDEATLAQALRYVEGIEANLGGTELFAPLADICGEKAEHVGWRLRHRPGNAARPPSMDSPWQVILLTDGQVSNEPAVLEMAQRHRNRVRIFAFGIGPASSQYLVRGLAEGTGGVAEFIAQNEAIEEKVLRTFSRLGGPMVSEVKLEWRTANDEARTAELAPELCPPLFEGDAVTWIARFSATPGIMPPRRFLLAAQSSGGALACAVELSEPASGSNTLPQLWARRRIKALEGAVPGDPAQNHARMIELSRQYGVLCSQTAFVAVEYRSPEERAAGRPLSRRVPLQLAAGWGGVTAGGAYRMNEVRGLTLSTSVDRSCSVDELAAPAPAGSVRHRGVPAQAKLHNQAPAAPPKPAAALLTDPLLRLLQRQKADGFFDLPDRNELPDDLAKNPLCAEAEEWLRTNAATGMVAQTLPTVLALIALQRSFTARRPIWQRAYQKAIRAVALLAGVQQKELERFVTELATR